MTTEEKTKAYNKVREKIALRFGSNVAEEIFSEFEESEDERIRNCIGMCLTDANEQRFKDYNTSLKECIAWLEKQGENTLIEEIKRRKELYSREKEKAVLFAEKLSLGGRIAVLEELLVFANEKQGEQKPILDFKASNWYVSKVDGKIHDLTYNPTDKTEPTFKVGDWIVTDKNNITQIKAVNNGYYTIDNGMDFNMSYVDKYWRLWTIQDAKDGDVLAEDSCIFIIKKLNQDLSAKVYCCLHDDGDFEINSTLGFDNTSTYPATKEQRDLLFQKMKEAGCEFDFEKKELKKIDQKPTYMIKPKFKVGDWIVDKSGLVQQVLDFRGGIYTCTYSSFTTGCESNYHLWTIDNARDGDVLADGNFVGLFKENNYNPSDESGCTCFYCSFDMDNNKFYTESGGYNPTYLYPATKEQEELLFQKMKEAGCKFDFDKKELKKIDPWYTPKYKVGDTVYYSSFGEVKSMVVANVVTDSTDNPMYEDENGSAIFEKDIIEQKPAWSKEDERIYQSIIDDTVQENQLDSKQIDWLKNIKYRNFAQTKQEWSKDDEYVVKELGGILYNAYGISDDERETCTNWLKSIEGRVHSKSQWTDEDEIKRDLVYNALNSTYDIKQSAVLSQWLNRKLKAME